MPRWRTAPPGSSQMTSSCWTAAGSRQTGRLAVAGGASCLAEHGRALDLVAVDRRARQLHRAARRRWRWRTASVWRPGVPVVGVTVGEALPTVARRLPVWAAIDSKRGRVFLERDGVVESLSSDALPMPAGPIALGGDAAMAVSASACRAGRRCAAADARRRRSRSASPRRGRWPGRTAPAQPLYVDPPAARPGPAGRPAPA